jgi:hypothetical protein
MEIFGFDVTIKSLRALAREADVIQTAKPDLYKRKIDELCARIERSGLAGMVLIASKLQQKMADRGEAPSPSMVQSLRYISGLDAEFQAPPLLSATFGPEQGKTVNAQNFSELLPHLAWQAMDKLGMDFFTSNSQSRHLGMDNWDYAAKFTMANLPLLPLLFMARRLSSTPSNFHTAACQRCLRHEALQRLKDARAKIAADYKDSTGWPTYRYNLMGAVYGLVPNRHGKPFNLIDSPPSQVLDYLFQYSIIEKTEAEVQTHWQQQKNRLADPNWQQFGAEQIRNALAWRGYQEARRWLGLRPVVAVTTPRSTATQGWWHSVVAVFTFGLVR